MSDALTPETGLVIAVNRNAVDVLLPDGYIERCRLHGRYRSEAHRGEGVVVGDRAVLAPAPQPLPLGALPATRTVARIEPRSTVLRRHLTSRGENRVREDLTVAANVDLCLVVQSYHDPAFRSAVADRLIALARASTIPVAMVLNKSDGVSDGEIHAVLAPYRRLGIECFAVSALSGMGMQHLTDRCAGQLTVMLGPSGVGKSTLTSSLTSFADLATGDVSDSHRRRGRGRHTTVQSRIYPLRGGGYVIDTAGIRSLALPEGTDPLDAFPEIARLSPACRFADCTHRYEPGCAVREAVAAGSLPRQAYDGYLRVLNDQASQPTGRGYNNKGGVHRKPK